CVEPSGVRIPKVPELTKSILERAELDLDLDEVRMAGRRDAVSRAGHALELLEQLDVLMRDINGPLQVEELVVGPLHAKEERQPCRLEPLIGGIGIAGSGVLAILELAKPGECLRECERVL